ncbi:MAG: rod shape-determining protein MreD [Thermoleophilia bacterium]
MGRERFLQLGRLGILLLIAIVLQTVVGSQLSFLGVAPDVFVILVVLVAVGSGSSTGLVYGFVVGITADTVFLDPIGMRAFMYLLIGYGVGRYVEEFGLASAWVVVILAGMMSLASQVVYGILQVAMDVEGSFFSMLTSQILPAALFDGLLAAPMYLGLQRIRLLSQPRSAGTIFG